MPALKKEKHDSKSKVKINVKKKSNFPAVKKDDHDSRSKMEICGHKKIKEVVSALKSLNKKFVEEDMKKQPLLEDTTESYIYLQLMLKKIPPPQLIRMIRVSLPHSLVSETSEICLITGDLEKRNHKAEVEPTVLHYKDLLRKQGVTKVSQVIPLRQLRTEYKTFESRRQLAGAYDVFLVDKKIAGVMAKSLGKSFFQSRKFPIQIDMERPNLKDQIDKALCQAEFSLTCRGNSYALEVARLSMEDEAIVENIKTCIEVFENKLPGHKENILSLYLKTSKSKAIPIYVSLDIPDEILIKKPRKNDKYKLDELSTMDNAEVKVFRDGRVILRKIKESNSQEDADENDKKMNLDEPFLDDLMESEEDTQEPIFNEGSLKSKKKTKKVSEVNEMTSREMENDEDSSKASIKKKKKLSDLVEVMTNTVMSDEDIQESISNKCSYKRKRKSEKICDAIEMTNISEMENVQDSKRKKKNKKYDLVEVTTNNVRENEEVNQDSTTNEVSAKKKKKGKRSAYVDENTATVEIENKDVQDSLTANISPKKKKGKKSFLDQTIENNEIQDSVTADISSKKKKKGRKSILDETTDIVEKEIEEIQDSVTADISPEKKRKGRKSILDQAVNIVENDDIHGSVTAEISPKKKKKERKSILNQLSTIKSEETTQNSPSRHTPSKKKNNKNNKS